MDLKEKKHYMFQLKELGDQRGGMIAVSSGIDIPFPIRRVFYNYKTSYDAVRGDHANKYSSFVMTSVIGSCTVEIDEGDHVTEYKLDDPGKALFIGRGLWKRMKDFSDDNILLVFSDYEYDPEEYIRNFDDYLNLIK